MLNMRVTANEGLESQRGTNTEGRIADGAIAAAIGVDFDGVPHLQELESSCHNYWLVRKSHSCTRQLSNLPDSIKMSDEEPCLAPLRAPSRQSSVFVGSLPPWGRSTRLLTSQTLELQSIAEGQNMSRWLHHRD